MKWTEQSQVWREQGLGFASMLLAIVLFSTVEVSSKVMIHHLPPLLLAVTRFAITGALLLIPALATLRWRQAPLTWADAGRLFLLGSVGVAASISLFNLALQHMQANVGAIVFSANPVFVILFSPWLVKEKLSWKSIAGVLMGLAGIAVFVQQSQADRQSITGILLMLGAEIVFAFYTVLSKKYMPRYGALVITCFAGLIGSALLLPFSWIFEGPPLAHFTGISWGGLLYLSVFATAIAYAAFFFGLVTVGAARGSMFFFLKPVLASFFAWWILGERLTPPMAAGAALILGALVFALLPSRPHYLAPE